MKVQFPSARTNSNLLAIADLSEKTKSRSEKISETQRKGDGKAQAAWPFGPTRCVIFRLFFQLQLWQLNVSGQELNLIVDDSRPNLESQSSSNRLNDAINIPSDDSSDDEEPDEDDEEPYEDAFQDPAPPTSRRSRRALSMTHTEF